ncbi:vesicle-trafficking protein SEC22a-like [Patiria miniata]|uniref:Longin domain-containing protein n=1 Tax=Patiria miniata TaxID=46514 RepID=A0A913Z056_PATMI|nr:vesicle-trafficking protein SEC22a-like [Patiria miniata]
MVQFAMITRLKDGLPLSATTDHEPSEAVLTSKKYAKLISKRASRFPDRCSLFTGSHWLHLISSLGVCFIMMCEENYPTVLAFCFLDEIQRSFISTYDGKRVANCRRPYALIEFDTVIKKTKQRFNNTRTLQTKINLTNMSQEVKLRPPHRITIEELGPLPGDNHAQERNGVGAHVYRPPAANHEQFIPLNWLGKLALSLCLLCCVLNLIRIGRIINAGPMILDDAIHYTATSAGLFLASSLLGLLQCFLLVYRTSWRTSKNLLALLCLASVEGYLFLHAYRYGLTSIFTVLAAVLAAWRIHTRTVPPKLPDYTV